MCTTSNDGDGTEEQQPSLRTSWANLTQPGPWGWKLRRLVANTAIKARRRQPCCGHAGEPGC